MRIYISGPMTSIAEWNFPAFNEEAKALKEMGHEVFNPADHGEGDWNDLLKKDIQEVCKADAVVVLEGWKDSRGAKLEVHVAQALGIPVYKRDRVQLQTVETTKEK